MIIEERPSSEWNVCWDRTSSSSCSSWLSCIFSLSSLSFYSLCCILISERKKPEETEASGEKTLIRCLLIGGRESVMVRVPGEGTALSGPLWRDMSGGDRGHSHGGHSRRHSMCLFIASLQLELGWLFFFFSLPPINNLHLNVIDDDLSPVIQEYYSNTSITWILQIPVCSDQNNKTTKMKTKTHSVIM